MRWECLCLYIRNLRAFGFLEAIISVRSGASLWGIIEYVPSLQWICGSLLSLHTFFGSNLSMQLVFDKPFNWNMSSFDMFGPANDEPRSKKRTWTLALLYNCITHLYRYTYIDIYIYNLVGIETCFRRNMPCSIIMAQSWYDFSSCGDSLVFKIQRDVHVSCVSGHGSSCFGLTWLHRC